MWRMTRSLWGHSSATSVNPITLEASRGYAGFTTRRPYICGRFGTPSGV